MSAMKDKGATRDRIEAAADVLAQMPIGRCPAGWLYVDNDLLKCRTTDAVAFIKSQGFSDDEAVGGINAHRRTGRLVLEVPSDEDDWFGIALGRPHRRTKSMLRMTPLFLQWLNERTSNPITVDVQGCTATVARNTHHIDPHHAQMLDALVRAAKNGTCWVTGPEMTQLPACKGKKIDREFKKLKKMIPELEQYIKSGGSKGYHLKL